MVFIPYNPALKSWLRQSGNSPSWLVHQDLGQARPAEEIWLDALITVLEEAAVPVAFWAVGGQFCPVKYVDIIMIYIISFDI